MQDPSRPLSRDSALPSWALAWSALTTAHGADFHTVGLRHEASTKIKVQEPVLGMNSLPTCKAPWAVLSLIIVTLLEVTCPLRSSHSSQGGAPSSYRQKFRALKKIWKVPAAGQRTGVTLGKQMGDSEPRMRPNTHAETSLGLLV